MICCILSNFITIFLNQTLTPPLLGPYASTYRSMTFNLVPLSDLTPGLNTEKVVLGRVVCHIRHDDGVPL